MIVYSTFISFNINKNKWEEYLKKDEKGINRIIGGIMPVALLMFIPNRYRSIRLFPPLFR